MIKKICLVYVFILVTIFQALSAEGIVGFWKTIDENSGKARSVIAIYEYQGKYYGRIIGTFADNGVIKETMYNPKERAPGVVGNPFYSGLDIIWNLKNKGNKYVDGQILDPQKGRVYGAELWNQDGKLIVRGKIFFFGRNQTWLPFTDFDGNFKMPDLKQFTPKIPKVK